MMRRVLVATVLFMLAVPALAHKASDSYLRLTLDAGRIEGQWDIALRDLDYAIGLDSDGDGAITWGEVRQRERAISAYVLPRLALRSDEAECTLRMSGLLVDHHTDGAYVVLPLAVQCPRDSTSLNIEYSLLFDLDAQHRGLLRLEVDGQTQTAVFAPDRRSQHFVAGTQSAWQQFLDYCREGVWHIWIGYDHILFLCCLLLPAVLRRDTGYWLPVARFGEAFWEVFKVVTAFTAAHSITLSLAALGVIELPSRLVESAIALSVILAALNNLWPLIDRRRWLVAFGFGLVHGLGFANVLRDLGLPDGSLLMALFGFNVGVELGQLAIVAALLPLIYLMRERVSYRRVALGLGSLAIAAVATLWFTERAFNLDLPLI